MTEEHAEFYVYRERIKDLRKYGPTPEVAAIKLSAEFGVRLHWIDVCRASGDYHPLGGDHYDLFVDPEMT